MSVRRGHRTGGKSHSRVPGTETSTSRTSTQFPPEAGAFRGSPEPRRHQKKPFLVPDGRLAFSANRAEKYGDLFVMNANGSARRNVTATPNVSESDPDSSPDGDELAFMALQDSGRLFVRRVDGTNPRE